MKKISKERASELMDRFLKGKPLALNETVFILEKLVRKLITEPDDKKPS